MRYLLIILAVFFGYVFSQRDTQPIVTRRIYHTVRNDDYDPLLYIFALPLFLPWVYLFCSKTLGAVIQMGDSMGDGGGGDTPGCYFTMKAVIFAALAVLSVIGMTTAQFGYGYGSAQTNDDSIMSFGALALLFVFYLLFTYRKSVPLYFGNQSLGVNVQTGLIG